MCDEAINFKASLDQLDLIVRAAAVLGKNRSDFVLEAACERAREVVIDQVLFSLDAKKFQQFSAMLDAPAAPDVGLKRLMDVQALWVSHG